MRNGIWALLILVGCVGEPLASAPANASLTFTSRNEGADERIQRAATEFAIRPRGGDPWKPGGLQADLDGCTILELQGAADGFTGGGSSYYYVKSFDVGEAVESQLVITVAPDAQGSYNFAAPDAPDVLLYQPFADGVVTYRPSIGSIVVSGDVSTGDASFAFNNVRLVQTIGQRPVRNGACYRLWDNLIEGYEAVPGGWTCSSDTYSDGFCQCGCGVPDPDCTGDSVRSCDVCGSAGSCSEGTRGRLATDAENNWECDFTEPEPDPEPETVGYDDVSSTFANVCGDCHSFTYDSLSDLVDPGSPDDSLLWQRITDPINPMPPAYADEELSNADRNLIQQWILDGALP